MAKRGTETGGRRGTAAAPEATTPDLNTGSGDEGLTSAGATTGSALGTGGTTGTAGTTGAGTQSWQGQTQGWQSQTNQGQQGGPGVTRQAKEQVKGLASQAKEETKKVVGQARSQVEQLVSQQTDQAAHRLGSVATALREAGRKLNEEDSGGFGRYADQAASQVDKLSNYLREKDLNSLVRDCESFARRRPDLFLGGTFIAGLLLARFLKSSSPQYGRGWEGDPYRPTLPMPERSEYAPERRNPDEAAGTPGYGAYNAPLGV